MARPFTHRQHSRVILALAIDNSFMKCTKAWTR